MNKQFLNQFQEIRDESLSYIKNNNYNWNRFIIFWARQFDKYSVDNILNLYSYNPNGRYFMTFDDWNSDTVDRRIKPKSKGIPIIEENNKIYVFDIKQTYGKDFYDWNYKHFFDDIVIDYYHKNLKVQNNNTKNIYENFYNIFY